MKAFRYAAPGAAAIVALILGWLWLAPSSAALHGSDSVVAASEADAGTAGLLARLLGKDETPAGTPTFITGLEHLPHSLDDTEVDGTLEADANGHLKITNGVRHVFDYFLATLGEESLDTIVARLHAYFRSRLPPQAAAEAERLLADYLAYKKELVAIDTPTTSEGRIDVDAMRARLDQVQALRGKFLSAAASDAFYADDDAFDRYALDRQVVLQQPGLTPVQQAQRLAALEDGLPPSLQASMKALNQYQNLEQLTGDWQQRAASPAELRQIRETLVGAEAADRLESLDAERTAWDTRMSAWFAERANVLDSTGLDAADREQQLDRLRAARFSQEEIARVQALEHLHDGTASGA